MVICSIDMKLVICFIDMKDSMNQKHFIETLHWFETLHCYETLHKYEASDMLQWYVRWMKHMIYVKHVWWYWKTETRLITKSYWLHWYDVHFFGCHYFKVTKSLDSLLRFCCWILITWNFSQQKRVHHSQLLNFKMNLLFS